MSVSQSVSVEIGLAVGEDFGFLSCWQPLYLALGKAESLILYPGTLYNIL